MSSVFVCASNRNRTNPPFEEPEPDSPEPIEDPEEDPAGPGHDDNPDEPPTSPE